MHCERQSRIPSMWQCIPFDTDLLIHLVGAGYSTHAGSSPTPAECPPSATPSAGSGVHSALWQRAPAPPISSELRNGERSHRFQIVLRSSSCPYRIWFVFTSYSFPCSPPLHIQLSFPTAGLADTERLQAQHQMQRWQSCMDFPINFHNCTRCNSYTKSLMSS